MAKTFATNVSIYHEDMVNFETFAAGDEVPDWVLELDGDRKVGDHLFEESDEVDVRLTDPHFEDDDPAVTFTTPIRMPRSVDPTVAEDVDDEEDELDSMTKDELKDLAEERGLAVSGNKEELKARIREDMESDDSDDEE